MVETRRVVVLCAMVLCAVCTRADVLHLQNGDRISGTLAGLSEGVLRFRGDFTGAFELSWTDVHAITTEEEIELVFHDGLSLTGTLRLLDDRQALAAEGEVKPIELDTVATIAVPGVQIADALAEPVLEDVSDPAEADAPKKWSGTVTASTAWRKGKTDRFDATVGASVVRTWEDDVLTLKTEAAYGEIESIKRTQRILGELKWQHYWTQRFYTYWLGGAEHDAARQLDLRLRTSAGLGKEFIDNERRKLSLEAGFGYRREYWLEYDLLDERRAKASSKAAQRARLNQLIDEIGSLTGLRLIYAGLSYHHDINALKFRNERTSEDSVNVRFSGRYEQQVFARSRFSSDLTYEPDIDDPSDFPILSDLTFLTPLSERISMRIRLNSEYDSSPGDGSPENWEHRFVTGLEYKF